MQVINIPNKTISSPQVAPGPACIDRTPMHADRSTGVGRSAGVGDPTARVNVPHDESSANDGLINDCNDDINASNDESDGLPVSKTSVRTRTVKPPMRLIESMHGMDHDMTNFKQPMGELFLTEQVSLNKGLWTFRKSGATAVVSKLHQLDRLKTIEPTHPKDVTQQQKREALRYLMYLKEK